MDIQKKIWMVAVNMGYGHQRTAYPLKDFSSLPKTIESKIDNPFEKKVIIANDYKEIPAKDRCIWEMSRKFYETISNIKKIPLVGNFFFSLYDKFQEIPNFYPHRDLSKPNFSLKVLFYLIKKGWGRDLISRLREKNARPFVTTFFIPAFMAEIFNYPGEIFCIICDADISRNWVTLDPAQSRIKYFAPNSWVVERLRFYGVKKENIFLTGYPLPLENIGTEKKENLKEDLKYRILNLDITGEYQKTYKPLIDKYLGTLPIKPNHPLTLMFSIGGAGAQKELVIKFVKSLFKKIESKEIKIILSAGNKQVVKDYFVKSIKKIGLKKRLGDGIEIIFSQNTGSYFKEFNQKLRKTDILWTKPSELSFYSGLGLPLIIAPSIGSQEDFNRKWLLSLGSGILEENSNYAHQWLLDFLESGRFAEAAMQGFLEAGSSGTYNIAKICFGL
jgi:hypothetical protein